MPKATQQEDPEVVAYQDPLFSEKMRALAASMGCDPDSEVWDGTKCVPKGLETDASSINETLE